MTTKTAHANLSQAKAALLAAGITARFIPGDEMTDDEFRLTENASVQVSATRNGLVFTSTVESGAGDDWGITFGRETRDVVAAAREALLQADA